ncbi:MAG: hypothetical protein SGPRY_010016, partial [Prymnesium sp.]
MGRALPPCFSSCGSCAPYARGRWVVRNATAPYELGHAVWRAMGLHVLKGSSHDHGQCSTRGASTLYDWLPYDCALQTLERLAVCELLTGKQIVLVGDSQTSQIFISMVMILEGRSGLGVDVKPGASVLSDTTASVCNDTVRLNFIRSDLLTWSNSKHEGTAIRKCNKKVKLSPFIARVSRHADLLILGTGLHVPASVPQATSGTSAIAARDIFFSQSLNHTLMQAIAARRRVGHSPESIVLVSASIPVPGCSQHTHPISAVQALSAMGNTRLNEWTNDWRDLHLINQAARWAALESGIGFIDVGPLSAQRPDATMARYAKTPMSDGGSEDCVHFCQPGPVDTWVTLIFNYWKSFESSFAGGPIARRVGVQENRAFFRFSRSEWLSSRGSTQ